jgi:outer membrane protein OmpA-like peptidoglycan-associated protein
MNKRWIKPCTLIVCGSLVLAGCATDEYGNRRPLTETEMGVGIGALTGAAIGAVAARKSAKGAAIGAVGGALVGGLVGNYMEKQRRDFEKVLAPEIAAGVIQVQKLPNDQILVGMTSESTFEVDSAQIKPDFYSTMDKIANVVNKYGNTHLAIAGYTDSTGSAAYNQGLSERRAVAVRTYLLDDGVYPARMTAAGYGKRYPVASNSTEQGRSRNRRVDITIIPVTAET